MHWRSRSAFRRGADDTELERSQWCEQLELVSTQCAGLQAAVMCAKAARSGARRSVRLPLRDIRFDEGRDAVTLALGGVAGAPALRLYIEHPRRIWASASAQGRSLVLTERSGPGVRILIPDRAPALAARELAGAAR